ncbi:MotA/TolQ/ExbB proton channel family protein [Nitrosomonas sp.]|uniref:MotA/TolQ/ExbB proton channel family protein n=1 Tax=Nitrosomonas sp. TaxID=42353 RepID=UPI0025F24A60|nr:MotA/TolQ/ExbB proton channel family protein [Nitrosomonas sp.]MCC6916273.1 MotA/TolQ/ExbB proton channel family protein [Nitrosomonas sp.]
MNALESLFYEISRLFLTPVLILLGLMFVYALFATGTLLVDTILRHAGNRQRQPLAIFMQTCPAATQEILELHLLRLIEPLRITSRVTPMLGLVATMIPMGPALIAVSEGNSQGMAQSLIVAFSAVIIALLTASLSYFVLTVRRRWLLEELENILGSQMPAHLSGVAHG